MGRDRTGRLDGLRPEEKFAAVLVEEATGAQARAHDVGGAQGAYDVHLTYKDGRAAALEVTTCSGPGVRQLEAVLRADGWTWPNPGRWWWTASVRDVRDVPRLRASYRHIVLLCEERGVTDPRRLPYILRDRYDDLRWLTDESSCRLSGHPDIRSDRDDGSRRGVIVQPAGQGAAVDTHLTALPKAVTELLSVDDVARRAAKVAAAAADERHLFLVVLEGALPDGIYIAMVGRMPEALPDEPPVLPRGLTHLWLSTRWSGSPLIGWSADLGWTSRPMPN